MYCLSVTYPITEDTHFDHDYYMSNHMSLCAKLFKEHGYVGHILRGAQGKAPGDESLSYVSIDLVFNDQSSLQAALGASGKEITDDIPNYTNAKPRMTFSEISMDMS